MPCKPNWAKTILHWRNSFFRWPTFLDKWKHWRKLCVPENKTTERARKASSWGKACKGPLQVKSGSWGSILKYLSLRVTVVTMDPGLASQVSSSVHTLHACLLTLTHSALSFLLFSCSHSALHLSRCRTLWAMSYPGCILSVWSSLDPFSF